MSNQKQEELPSLETIQSNIRRTSNILMHVRSELQLMVEGKAMEYKANDTEGKPFDMPHTNLIAHENRHNAEKIWELIDRLTVGKIKQGISTNPD